jgi:hypothetical protein
MSNDLFSSDQWRDRPYVAGLNAKQSELQEMNSLLLDFSTVAIAMRKAMEPSCAAGSTAEREGRVHGRFRKTTLGCHETGREKHQA